MCERMFPEKRVAVLFCPWLLVVLAFAQCLAADGGPKVVPGRAPQRINVEIGKSVIVQTSRPVSRVSVAEPAVADYILLSPNQIYLTGKGPGVTNMTLWGPDDKISAIYDIESLPDVSRISAKLRQVLPGEKDIGVHAAHDSITLTGKVGSTSSAAHALAVAEAFKTRPEQKIINLIEVGGVQQVMLEVRVAEMSRSLGRRLGINFVAGNNGSIGTSLIGNLGTINDFTGGGTAGNLDLKFSEAINTLFHIAGGDFTFTQFMDALKEEGLIKVLAEPNLITLSGQEAKFIAGGEFPVPVPQGLGTVAIEYKEFGVALSFTPTVLRDRRINVQVQPEVSELDLASGTTIGGTAVPGITKRRVSTMVELADGQSFAIAGLLSDSVRETVSKFPFLGEIPVLGAMFRSTSYQRNETELIVIVTPHLVKPLDMAKQKLPGEDYVDPTDAEFYLLGLLKGRSVYAPASPLGLKGTTEGEFGHAVPKF